MISLNFYSSQSSSQPSAVSSRGRFWHCHFKLLIWDTTCLHPTKLAASPRTPKIRTVIIRKYAPVTGVASWSNEGRRRKSFLQIQEVLCKARTLHFHHLISASCLLSVVWGMVIWKVKNKRVENSNFYFLVFRHSGLLMTPKHSRYSNGRMQRWVTYKFVTDKLE